MAIIIILEYYNQNNLLFEAYTIKKLCSANSYTNLTYLENKCNILKLFQLHIKSHMNSWYFLTA